MFIYIDAFILKKILNSLIGPKGLWSLQICIWISFGLTLPIDTCVCSDEIYRYLLGRICSLFGICSAELNINNWTSQLCVWRNCVYHGRYISLLTLRHQKFVFTKNFIKSQHFSNNCKKKKKSHSFTDINSKFLVLFWHTFNYLASVWHIFFLKMTDWN